MAQEHTRDEEKPAAKGRWAVALRRVKHHPLLLIRVAVATLGVLTIGLAWTDLLSELAIREDNARTLIRSQALIQARAAGETVQATIERFDFSLKVTRSAVPTGLQAVAAQGRIAVEAMPPDLVLQQFLIDEDGYLIYSSLGPAPRNYLGDRDYFRRLSVDRRDSLEISPPVLGRLTGKWSIQIARAVTRNGHFAGVVSLAVSPDAWTKQLSHFESGPRDTLTLVDGTGRVLLRTLKGPEHYGKQAPQQRDYILHPERLEGDYVAHASVDGVLRQYAWTRLPSGLVMLSGIALDDALAPMREIKRSTLIRAGIFSALFTLVVATLLLALQRYERVVRQLGISEEHYRSVLTHTAEGILVLDEHDRIVDTNPAFSTITGIPGEDAHGQSVAILEQEQGGQKGLAAWLGSAGEGRGETDFAGLRRDGSRYTGHAVVSCVHDARGRVLRRVALITDVTEARRRASEIWHQANFDALTGLPNRVQLNDRLEGLLRQARLEDSGVTVLFVDLDRFKPVNDLHGHETGDLMLTQIGARLGALFREEDVVARLGGDEFIVAVPAESDAATDAALARKVIECLSRPFFIGGLELQISCCVGIAHFPTDGCSCDTLIGRADQAMYRAKAAGCGSWSH